LRVIRSLARNHQDRNLPDAKSKKHSECRVCSLFGVLLSGMNQSPPLVGQRDERKSMNRKFDELAKGLAQSTTRRQALQKFGPPYRGK